MVHRPRLREPLRAGDHPERAVAERTDYHQPFLPGRVRDTVQRREDPGLSDAEIAFYDALAENESAREGMQDELLWQIASELVIAVRKNVTIDWAAKESVRAKVRVMIKRIPRKYGYPPNMQERATKTVLEQAERICGEAVA